MAHRKHIPIGLKIGFAFFILGLMLLSVLFILLIPDMKKKQYDEALEQTQKIALLTKHQIRLVVDYFRRYASFEIEQAQKDIENIIHQTKIYPNANESYIHQQLQSINTQYNCQVELLDKNQTTLKLNSNKINQDFDFSEVTMNAWHNKDTLHSMCPHPSYFLYQTHIQNQMLQLTCSSTFKNSYQSVEKDVKAIVQEGFALTQNIHKGKVYLMWLRNDMNALEKEQPLYKLSNESFQNYCVSKISNFSTPQTGELPASQILAVQDTKQLQHELNEQDTLTWVSKIYEQDDANFLFVLSAYEKDFKANINNSLNTLLPISIVALIISSLFGIFLFKRWINDIQKLSDTARAICSGRLNFRSRIQSKDEIGVLGHAFDTMLDKLEDNIKNLDSKVALRTKELEESLHSKEILLKEIHHRVKNNLSLTINFLKLQQHKEENEALKEVLQDIENRIYTMALLHTKLYESKELDAIEFKTYLEELIDEIALSYQNGQVEIVYDIESVNLNIDEALPCGMIINEILINAFKHAFEQCEQPKIEVKFKQVSDEYLLKISDNGKGMPNHFSLTECESLGLRLLHLIVQTQLEGEVKMYNECGLHYEIRFKK